MDFVKDVWNVKISILKPKKKLVVLLRIFSDVTFHPETVSTNITQSIWLFIWKRQFRHRNVKSVENISRRNKNCKTCAKKNTLFFLVPIWIFQHFRHLLQNPKPKWMANCFSNHSLDLYFSKSLDPYHFLNYLFYLRTQIKGCTPPLRIATDLGGSSVLYWCNSM